MAALALGLLVYFRNESAGSDHAGPASKGRSRRSGAQGRRPGGAAGDGAQGLAQARAMTGAMADYSGQAPDGVSASDIEVPGPAGPIRVRLTRPDGAALPPLLVWYHGGGAMAGSLEGHDVRRCASSTEATGWAIASVDYRLAPEHPLSGPPGRLPRRHARPAGCGRDARLRSRRASPSAAIPSAGCLPPTSRWRCARPGEALPEAMVLVLIPTPICARTAPGRRSAPRAAM